jgi:pimeloyl-ACP methyl ester carboxylesterase
MTANILLTIMIWMLFGSGVALAEMPAGSAYLDGGDSEYALILSHGVGQSPTALVVEPLRHAVHQTLGWHTLSLSMPREENWSQFGRVFPQAFERISQAIDFLKREKGVRHVYLMGHSMGSRMSSAYLADNPDASVRGLIVAGIRHDGGIPMNGRANLQHVDLPVLDIWGEEDGRDSMYAAERRDLVSPRYTQVSVTGANHSFEPREDEFSARVVEWLRRMSPEQMAASPDEVVRQ